MKSAEQKEMMIFIDRYLTEEDKDRICSNSPAGKVRTFPGSEMFYMYSESNRVKSFIENGHYSSVIGFLQIGLTLQLQMMPKLTLGICFWIT